MIKIGIVGYGTIGKRVADAVLLQDDMQLMGITANSFNYKISLAYKKKIPVFNLKNNINDFKAHGIELAGNINDLIKQSDIIVDCSPKPYGKENKERYYLPLKKKAIFQGGEKKDVADISFVAQCNYNDSIGKDYIRVVSCNTTGLSRTLNALDREFGVVRARATLIRRAADPGDVKKGPLNSIIPSFELPSHHGPDVRTVLYGMEVFTTAVVVPTTLMHMHNLNVVLKKKAEVEEVVNLFKRTERVKVIPKNQKIDSTAQIMEYAKDLHRIRGDIMEICVWEQGIGNYNGELFFPQAVHQEADVIPENIDAIRAAMGFKDAVKSIKKTNNSLGIN
ncbi:type II glyceraldehyde-3-phosphate dehydrogenase [Candidatus Woesearchaeota archaeon]|nr:type II glyceraldehyde-3-phosphate dehydrogenase [Candidatus Woesearchaeota archaeon]